MAAGPAVVVEEAVEVGGTRLQLLRGGQGRPVVVLHGIEGPEGWLAFHEALAQDVAVYAPAHPGYGETKRPGWLETITHQAVFYEWFLQEAGLSEIDLVGFGVGGWIAAEMATMCPHNLRHLVLADAAGIRPQSAAPLDIFIRPWREVVESCFYDASQSAEFQRIYGEAPVQDFGGPREAGRSMSMRMCYRPYMYSPALPGMLGKVRVPTLIVWGADDRVMPVECAQLYQAAIPGARLEVIERCGHWPHYEQPEALAQIVRQFLST